jgi:hypothetical protein
MDWQIDIYYLVFLGFCITTTWIVAKREGISQTLDFLKERGEIDFDED